MTAGSTRIQKYSRYRTVGIVDSSMEVTYTVGIVDYTLYYTVGIVDSTVQVGIVDTVLVLYSYEYCSSVWRAADSVAWPSVQASEGVVASWSIAADSHSRE